MVEHTLFERVFIYVTVRIVSVALTVTTVIFKLIGFLLGPVLNQNKEQIPLKPYGHKEHKENVQKVQNQVKAWDRNGRKSKMCTGRPGWKATCTRNPIYKDTLTQIHIDMDKLIYMKTDGNENSENIVCVEPMMSIGELTRFLEPKGWTLPVVPELDSLTIGGLVCGAGIETSSHKYGLFHNTCISFEIVLSSGEVIKCTSENEHSDLFHAIPGSHGTLGFLTAVELQIIPAKTHVKLEYIPVRSLAELISTFEAQTYRKDKGNEFVEGLMYSLNSGIIMVGEMTSAPPDGKVNHLGKWYKPWFYKHVESFLHAKPPIRNNGKFIEYIPLCDYYHRHTRPLFWITSHTIPYGNNLFFRYLLGWTLPPRVDFAKRFLPTWVKDLMFSNLLVQDFVIPLEKLKSSLELTHKEMEVYPIWLCPAKFKNTPGACPVIGDSDEMYVDVGVYGVSLLKHYDTVESAKKWEMFCLENRGYQALYSDVYLTREEFGKMFKLDLYWKVRKQYKCEDAFPEVYEKICRNARR